MSFPVMIVGCVAWIPLGVWIVSLINWMIAGEVDFLSGVLGIWIAIGLGYLAFNPPPDSPIVSLLTFGAILATIAMYPLVRNALARREHRSLDIEGLEKAYQALRENPVNPLAKFRIAKQAYGLGMPGHALAIAESVLPAMPERHFTEEHRLVKHWKAVVTNPDYFHPIVCVECTQSNPPGEVLCRRCAAPFLIQRARGRFISSGLGRRLIAAWMAMVAVIAGIPAAATLPPSMAVGIIVALLALVGLSGWLAFRPRPGSWTA